MRHSRRAADGRTVALASLLAVLDGRDGRGQTLDGALQRHLATLGVADNTEAAGHRAREAALARELATGTLRYYFSLQEEVSKYLTRPFERLDPEVAALLLLGAYQIRHARVPAYAAVSATVDMATTRVRSAAGLVNAVLRRVANADSPAPQSAAARWEHPDWLIDALQSSLGDAAGPVMEANQTRAPLTVRVNVARTTQADFLADLAAHGIAASAGGLSPTAVHLGEAMPAERVPGLTSGVCTIQDEGAQLAVQWLAPAAGERVLDACAAPGNKATQILELAASAHLTAIDANPRRVETLRANLRRCGSSVEPITADAMNVSTWWNGQPFDAILVDAPCSALGTLRRHPDIKVRLSPQDIAAFSRRQLSLLAALWPCLAPGGRLVYCTCSLLPEENERVIAHFVESHPDAEVVLPQIASLLGDAAVDRGGGLLLLPQRQGADGYFLARLLKQPQKRIPSLAPTETI